MVRLTGWGRRTLGPADARREPDLNCPSREDSRHVSAARFYQQAEGHEKAAVRSDQTAAFLAYRRVGLQAKRTTTLVFAFLRRRIAKPTAPMPRIISAQVAGSGTAATLRIDGVPF
jgi:hypothetical protein